jgi:hypothetical protein
MPKKAPGDQWLEWTHAAATARPQTRFSATRAQPKQARRRRDRRFRYKRPRVPDLRDRPKFRYFARFANGRTAELEDVLSCSWDDATAILTGSLSLALPRFGGRQRTPEQRLEKGDQVACYVSMHGEPYRYVWTMRVFKPEYHAADHQRSFDLMNDLEMLRQSEDKFVFKAKDRRHPHGWTGPQIIREVCRRYAIPIGGIYGSSRPLTKNARIHAQNPLEVIRQVVTRERKRHGRRVFIRWYRGRLYVLPLRRSPDLLLLGPTLIDAVLASELPEQFASALTIRSVAKEKLHLRLESKVSQRLYGYVHKNVWSAHAKTPAALRAEGMAYLRAAAKPKQTLSLSHAGIPFIRRGDAIRVELGDRAMRRQILWVNHVTHQAQAEGYSMEVEMTFEDPFISRRGQSVLTKLKASRDDAVANRARLDPLWYVDKNNKGDAGPKPPGPDPFSEGLRGR